MPPPLALDVDTRQILSAADGVNSRAFASSLHLGDGHYLVCFSKRYMNAPEYAVYCQKFQNLRTSNPTQVGEEFRILNAGDAEATEHVYIPYLFRGPSDYRILFTARGTPNDASEEWIGLARSVDGVHWVVVDHRVLVGEQDWEANSVENFGVVLFQGKLWMNYESRGPTRKESNRSIGLAYSLDYGESWTRISSEPAFSGGMYCAGFFRYEDEIYLVASNYNQFRVYRAESPEELSEEKYIGSFLIRDDETVVDTPSLISDSIVKKPSGVFALTYSLYEENGWNTYVSRWGSTEAFLRSLESWPKYMP